MSSEETTPEPAGFLKTWLRSLDHKLDPAALRLSRAKREPQEFALDADAVWRTFVPWSELESLELHSDEAVSHVYRVAIPKRQRRILLVEFIYAKLRVSDTGVTVFYSVFLDMEGDDDLSDLEVDSKDSGAT